MEFIDGKLSFDGEGFNAVADDVLNDETWLALRGLKNSTYKEKLSVLYLEFFFKDFSRLRRYN